MALPSALLDAVLALAADSELADALGEVGQDYSSRHLSPAGSLDRLLQAVTGVFRTDSRFCKPLASGVNMGEPLESNEPSGQWATNVPQGNYWAPLDNEPRQSCAVRSGSADRQICFRRAENHRAHSVKRMNDQIPVIDLSKSKGRREAWDRPAWQVYLWTAADSIFVTNPWQPSSGLRRKVLRSFGARIDQGVILRPRLRVKFPWKLLEIGARSWIGEDVWIHNQDEVVIGSDVVVSQGSFVTTGTHDFRGDMSLMTRPILIEDGAWITSRCIVLSGSRIRRSALVLPGTVVRGEVPAAMVFGTPAGVVVRTRFETQASSHPIED